MKLTEEEKEDVVREVAHYLEQDQYDFVVFCRGLEVRGEVQPDMESWGEEE